MGKESGPNGKFRDSGPVNVHTRKMKLGISMQEEEIWTWEEPGEEK